MYTFVGSNTEDYYSRSLGFIIDGRIFCDRNAAAEYLINDGMMADEEATHYLSRLVAVSNHAARKGARA